MSEERRWHVGDEVIKLDGDYRFKGWVVASFVKRSGQRRYVVENGDGVLHIFSGKQLVTSKLTPKSDGVAGVWDADGR